MEGTGWSGLGGQTGETRMGFLIKDFFTGLVI